MRDQGYLKAPEEIDLAKSEKSIRAAGFVSLAALTGAVPVGYFLLPSLFEFPEALAERLAFAARACVPVLFCVLVAVGMVSTGRRRSRADIGGSAAGPPSETIAIRMAFLQNTLEQAVLAAGLYFALATLVSGAWLSLLVVGVLFFVTGRVLFLRGYPRGAEGRALGMTLTMMPTILGYLLVLALMIARWM